MENIGIVWKILGILSVALLIGYFRRKNAVWGGFTGGITIGFIIAFLLLFKDKSFDWFIVGKAAIIGIMMGFFAELLGKITDHFKQK